MKSIFIKVKDVGSIIDGLMRYCMRSPHAAKQTAVRKAMVEKHSRKLRGLNVR